MRNKRVLRGTIHLHDEPDAQPAEGEWVEDGIISAPVHQPIHVTTLFVPFGTPDSDNTVIMRGAIPRLTIDVTAEEVVEPKLLDAEADKPENEVENK